MIYTFEDKVTGEEFDLEMTSDELEPFLKRNKKTLVRVFKMNIGDPVRLGIMKPPSDFTKYVLGKVKAKVHGNTIDRGRFQIPKEI